MPASHVQTVTAIDFGVSSLPVTVPSVAAGNVLIAFVSWLNNTSTVTVADNKGNTWAAYRNPTSAGSSDGRAGIFVALNVASGSTIITATIAGSAVTAEIHAMECVPPNAPGEVDGHNALGQVNPGTGTDAVLSGSVTTVGTGDMACAASFDVSNTSLPNAGSAPWTTRGAGTFGRSESQVQAAPGSIQGTFTETEGSSSQVSLIVTIKASVVIPPGILMPSKFADRVKETSTTTGAGDVTLAGAVAQFETFTANFAVGEPFFYAIVGQTGTEWEVGMGTLSSGTVLVRSRILQSSNADAVVTLSAGTKDVYVTISSYHANRTRTCGQINAAVAGWNLC